LKNGNTFEEKITPDYSRYLLYLSLIILFLFFSTTYEYVTSTILVQMHAILAWSSFIIV